MGGGFGVCFLVFGLFWGVWCVLVLFCVFWCLVCYVFVMCLLCVCYVWVGVGRRWVVLFWYGGPAETLSFQALVGVGHLGHLVFPLKMF